MKAPREDVADGDHADGGSLVVRETQRYIDLAGVLFADEVARLGDWYGRSGT